METKEKFVAVAIIVTAICIMAAIAPVSAGQVCWSDTFSDESGIAFSENITVSGGDAKISLPRWVYDSNPVLKIPRVVQWQTFGMAFNITGDGTWTSIIGEFYPPGKAHGYYWNGTQWISDPSRVAGLSDVRGAWPAMAFNVTGDGTWTLISGDVYGGFHGYYWNGTQWFSDPSRVAGLVNVECDSTPAMAFNITGDGTWTLISGELGHCGGFYDYYNCAGFYGYYWNGTQWVSDSSRVAGLGRIKCYSCPSIAFNPRGDGKWILISGDERGGWGGKFYGWHWDGTQWVSNSSIVAGLGGSGDWLHWNRAITIFNLTGNGKWSVITANDWAPQKGFCWSGGQWGKLTSTVITPTNLVSWDRFFANDTVPTGTSISYQILDESNNTIMNVVDGQDISGITAASIRLFGNLTTSTTSDSPLLHDWSVCWEEKELPPTPFLIYGYVNHSSGTPLNGPNVTITNTRTGEVFTAKTNESFNYYQVVTSSWNVSASDVLHFNATNDNSTEFDHSVTGEEINNGVVRQDIVIDNPDTTPPASITDLTNVTYEQTYINWTWTDPADADFSHVIVYVDGEPKGNVSKGEQHYNAAGFEPDTEHTIATRTEDTSGNINQTWVNHSARTAAAVQEGFWLQTTDADFNAGTRTNINVSGDAFQLSAVPSTVTIFHETFPNADGAWDGSSDTAQAEPGWVTYQGGDGDTNDVQVSDEDKGGSSPSGGNHLTFEDCDTGFGVPETSDIAYVSIDLSGYSGVEISYYWQSDDVDSGEGLRVAYSADSTDGKNGAWTLLDEHINEADDVWVKDTYSLPDANCTANFKLRFSAKMGSPNEHMYVDDVMVTGEGAGGYETSGSSISQTHDTGASEPAYTDIIAGNLTPEGTTVTVEVRAASTEAGLDSADWHTDIATVPHEQWVQWNVSLTGDGTNTPTVDDVNVTWTSEPDTTAPAAVEDLAASDPTSSSIKLTWTAPGDDGNTGNATSYDIRYSTTAINDSNWNSANCTEEPNPKPANSSETFTVTGLNANTTYYFALKTSDEVLNESPLSNVANGTTSEAPTDQMHIESIDMSLSNRTAGKNIFTHATALVTIVNATGVPVENATVHGYWSNATDDVDLDTTNSTGQVSLDSDEVKSASGKTFTFMVDNVANGWVWDGEKKSGTIIVP